MDEERQRRLGGHLGRGLLLSLVLHGSAIFPLVALAILFARREAQNRDLDVRFEEVSEAELPRNLPPLEPSSEAADPERRKKIAPKQPESQIAQPEDLPLPPEPPEPEEKKQDEPPKPPPPDKHEKMVDLDLGQDVEPPPEARYLAQKNNRAREETRATDTNLEREQKGTPGSSPSERKEEAPGDPDQKVAELEDQPSKLGRSAPAVVPRADPEMPRVPTPSRRSLLSMRQAERRPHEVTPETASPTLPPDPDGIRPFPRDRPESVRDLAPPGEARRPRLSLTGDKLDYLFGADAEAARRLAQKERSKRRGRFSERMGQIQSALENFIPEVRPGNQTELNTRAAPFAAFIARMHRSIHKLWGFGFLEDLDRKPASNRLNDPALVTKLELVLGGNGTVEKVTIVRTSGYLPFDVAAIDVVHSAGPFVDPPREIRSGNGRIYIHWTFHRDERQCATSGVDYYILENAPAGGDKEEPAGAGAPAEPHGDHGLPTPTSGRGLSRLRREAQDTAERPRRTREVEPEPDPEVGRRAAQQVARADDPAARAIADGWFAAYAAGDVGGMLAHAAFPFRSSSGVVAKNAGELRSLLRGLVDESPSKRTPGGVRLHSAAGARGALGALPPGFEDGQGLLFAVASVAPSSKDSLILVLARQGQTWKAIGLARR